MAGWAWFTPQTQIRVSQQPGEVFSLAKSFAEAAPLLLVKNIVLH
jgi:hypothetical protein